MTVVISPSLKSYSAQTIAILIKSILQFNVGLTITYPEILLSALTGQNVEQNPNETIRLTAQQASWLGSIGLAAQVLGSILSGCLGEVYGRKAGLIMVNVPHLMGWLLFYSATSIPHLYITVSLTGFAVGCMNAPAAVYAGEISEVSIRNIMTTITSISTAFGISLVYVLGNFADWRTVALYCAASPIVAFVALLFIPETPVWLLSRNREDEALTSLRWLRGWTSAEAVQEEFDSLKKYRDISNACSDCQRAQVKCTHPLPTLMDNFTAMFKANCMKPIIIFTICSVFSNFAGLHHISPYTVQILNTFNSPFNPNKAITVFGLTNILGTTAFTLVVKLAGKRSLYFGSLLGMSMCSLPLGIFAIVYLPAGIRSFDYEHITNSTGDGSIFPFIVIIFSKVFTAALIEVPFMYTSELFPLKARCFAAGVCSAIFSLVLFATSTTFYNMEMWFSLSYTLCIYGASGIIGIIALYRILPNTENVSLGDIERHFSSKQHKWTDWNIRKTNYTE